MKVCRIVSTILCALCLAAAPIVGIFLDFEWLVAPLFGAGLFFTLMLFFRKKHMEQEARENPTAPTGDFFNPIKDEETPNKETND